jgi:hypothetical protein
MDAPGQISSSRSDTRFLSLSIDAAGYCRSGPPLGYCRSGATSMDGADTGRSWKVGRADR